MNKSNENVINAQNKIPKQLFAKCLSKKCNKPGDIVSLLGNPNQKNAVPASYNKYNTDTIIPSKIQGD